MKLVKDTRTNSEVWASEAELKSNKFFKLIEDIKEVIESTEPLVDAIEDVIEDITGKDIDLNGNETKKKTRKSSKPKKTPNLEELGAEVEIKSPNKDHGSIEIEQDIE